MFLKKSSIEFAYDQSTITNNLTVPASAKLNKKHVLRVVYEKVGDRKLVVTFYPARRERYEG